MLGCQGLDESSQFIFDHKESLLGIEGETHILTFPGHADAITLVSQRDLPGSADPAPPGLMAQVIVNSLQGEQIQFLFSRIGASGLQGLWIGF